MTRRGRKSDPNGYINKMCDDFFNLGKPEGIQWH